jgi:hypothetical protein
LESVGPGEISAAAASLSGLGTVVIRMVGRLALAREQRTTMIMMTGALAGAGRQAQLRHRFQGGEWALEMQEVPAAGDVTTTEHAP